VTAATGDGPIADVLAAFTADGGDRLLIGSGLLAIALVRGRRLRRATPTFLNLFGLRPDAGPRALDGLAQLLLQSVPPEEEPGAIARTLCPVRLPSGRSRTVELRIARALVDRRPTMAFLASDATEQASEHERLQYLAMHDPLTGLPNRALMRDRLEQAVAADRRHAQGCAVLLVDLDGFKAINDCHGHATGDALLKEVADRLRGCSRESDAVARYGGDEFVVIASPIRGGEEAALLAARIVSELRREFTLEDGVVHIGASVGVALRSGAQRDAALNEDAGLLLSEADAAMYLAKGGGKNRYAFPKVDRESFKATPDLDWPRERIVGIPDVDREHAALSDGMNALLARVRAGEGSATLAVGLRELLMALARHFATEERHMRSNPGDWDAEHRAEHRRVMDDLRRLTAAITDESVALAIRYLHQWLCRHVESYDQRLGQVAEDHGAR
jgi:diguanylate cyclase (GGDEF)-like protein/hemerythrin-like metal-binding protein